MGVLAQPCLFLALSLAERMAHVTFLLNIEPLVAILVSVVVLGERPEWYRWTGLALLTASLSASALLKEKKPAEKTLPTTQKALPPAARSFPFGKATPTHDLVP